jgi:hypothetical protein
MDGGAEQEQAVPVSNAGENPTANASSPAVQLPDNTNKRKQRRKSTAPAAQDAAAPEAEAMEAAAAPAEHPTAHVTDLPAAVQQPAAADSAAAVTKQPQVRSHHCVHCVGCLASA